MIAPGQLDEWDYVLRRLFVLKASTLQKSLRFVSRLPHLDDFVERYPSSLSSGAAILKKVLSDPLLPENEQVQLSKTIKQLSIADWALIMRAFSNWPFKPSVKLDFCTHINLFRLTDPISARNCSSATDSSSRNVFDRHHLYTISREDIIHMLYRRYTPDSMGSRQMVS